MPRYVAFLRALNVGGRRVKMDQLRELFTGMGFRNVETFIASGNVVFDSPSRNVAALAASIESELEAALGFDVPTMLRTPAQITAAVASAREVEGHTLHVVFLERATTDAEAAGITALNNDVDRFEVGDALLYWWCRGRSSDTTVSGPKLERAAGMRATARSISSLRKLLAMVGACAT